MFHITARQAIKVMQVLRSRLRQIVLCKAPKCLYVAISLSCLLIFYNLDYNYGILIKLKEKDYVTEFKYPVFGDINVYIDELENGMTPQVAPYKNHNYTYLLRNEHSCDTPVLQSGEDENTEIKMFGIDLIILVKSAASNFEKRDSIRKTWGRKTQIKHIHTRTFFTLGFHNDKDIIDKVSKEHGKHKDIIQGDFTDAYFNNTIKTLMSLQWAYKYCDNSRYYLFVDDDYYVSNKNLLLFLKNPSKYEDYIKMSNLSEQNDYKNDLSFYGG